MPKSEGDRVVVVVDRKEQAGTVERVARVLTFVRLDNGQTVSRHDHELFDLFNDGSTP